MQIVFDYFSQKWHGRCLLITIKLIQIIAFIYFNFSSFSISNLRAQISRSLATRFSSLLTNYNAILDQSFPEHQVLLFLLLLQSLLFHLLLQLHQAAVDFQLLQQVLSRLLLLGDLEPPFSQLEALLLALGSELVLEVSKLFLSLVIERFVLA